MPSSVGAGARISKDERRANGLILWVGVSLLLWACYANGAFLSPAKTVLAFAAPGLGLLWAGLSLARDRRDFMLRLRPTTAEWFLLAMGLFGLVSVFWSIAPWDSLRASGTLLGALVFLRLGRRLAGFTPSSTSSVLFVIGEAGALVSVISVIAVLFSLPLFTQWLEGQLLTTGTFGYANAFAGFLLLTMASTVSLLSWSKVEPGQEEGPGRLMRRHGRALFPAMLAPQIIALVLTRTKGILAALSFILLVFLISRTLRPDIATGRLRVVRLGAVVLIVAGFLVGGVLLWKNVAPQMAVSGLPTVVSDPETGANLQEVVPMTSDAFRLKTWMTAARAARERPLLGYGLGTFYQAYSPFKEGAHTAYAHNLLVQQVVELGAIGVLLLVGFLGAAVVRPYMLLSGPLTNAQVPLLIGLQAFLLHNLVDLTWYFPALLLLFSLLCGLLPSLASPGSQTNLRNA